MPQVAIIDFIKQILITTLISSTPPTHPESSLSPTHYSHSLSLSLTLSLQSFPPCLQKQSHLSLSLEICSLPNSNQKIPSKRPFSNFQKSTLPKPNKTIPSKQRPLKGDTNQKTKPKSFEREREREREREGKAEHTFLEF